MIINKVTCSIKGISTEFTCKDSKPVNYEIDKELGLLYKNGILVGDSLESTKDGLMFRYVGENRYMKNQGTIFLNISDFTPNL